MDPLAHLPEHEREFVRFMQSSENHLGWRPLGRDEEGRAVAVAELQIPGTPQIRVCRVTLAPEGHIHHMEQVIGGSGG